MGNLYVCVEPANVPVTVNWCCPTAVPAGTLRLRFIGAAAVLPGVIIPPVQVAATSSEQPMVTDPPHQFGEPCTLIRIDCVVPGNAQLLLADGPWML